MISLCAVLVQEQHFDTSLNVEASIEPHSLRQMHSTLISTVPTLVPTSAVSLPPRESNCKQSHTDSEDEDEEFKKAALQEKNRKAQRRFRERQKQRVTELEDQVADLQGQLAALAAEKAMSQAQVTAVHHMLNNNEGANNSLESSHFDQFHEKLSPIANDGLERSVCAPMHTLDEEITLTLQSLIGSRKNVKEIKIDNSQLKSVTPDDLAKLYSAYVIELAQVLVDAGPGGGASVPRMHQLVEELSRLITHYSLLSPVNTKVFASGRVDGGDEGKQTDEELQRRLLQIVGALELSTEQKALLIKMRGIYIAKHQAIVAKKSSALSQLQLVQPENAVLVSDHAVTSSWLSAHQHIQALREALRDEHLLSMNFIFSIKAKVFSPMQMAKLMIHSHPWTPDFLALATHIGTRSTAEISRVVFPKRMRPYTSLKKRAMHEDDSAFERPGRRPRRSTVRSHA